MAMAWGGGGKEEGGPSIDHRPVDPSPPPPSPSKQHAANDQVALRMDADIAGGLFVKGFVLSAAQFREFDAACTKGNAVNVVRGLCVGFVLCACAGSVIQSFIYVRVCACVPGCVPPG